MAYPSHSARLAIARSLAGLTRDALVSQLMPERCWLGLTPSIPPVFSHQPNEASKRSGSRYAHS